MRHIKEKTASEYRMRFSLSLFFTTFLSLFFVGRIVLRIFRAFFGFNIAFILRFGGIFVRFGNIVLLDRFGTLREFLGREVGSRFFGRCRFRFVVAR